jgi:hypothetical protein
MRIRVHEYPSFRTLPVTPLPELNAHRLSVMARSLE